MNLLEARNHPLVEYARTNLWGSGVTTIPEQFIADFEALTPQLSTARSRLFYRSHDILSCTPLLGRKPKIRTSLSGRTLY